jgi:hypothetical protein
MTAFLQQLAPLLGVALGALGSYAAVTMSDRARWRRESTARWRERRLAVYSDYARAVKATITVSYRLAAHFGNDAHPYPLAPEDATAALAEASDARDPAWEALLMLGAPPVVDAGRAWFVTVAAMERFLRAGTRDPERWAVLLDEQRTARTGFYDTVRSDLAMPPGHAGRWQ